MFITELYPLESYKNLDFLLQNILDYCIEAGIDLNDTKSDAPKKPKDAEIKKQANVLIFPFSKTKH
jgi:hypothetical protein